MHTLIVIPARGGSKRLPGKNLRPLAGRTLMEWTALDIAEAGLDAPCLLTTDNEQIAETGRTLGWLVPFLRPPELATDQALTIDAALHALDWYAEHHTSPDAVMLVQVTSPLRGSRCLSAACEMLRSRSDADAVVGMREVTAPKSRGTEHSYVQGEDGFLRDAGANDGNKPTLTPNGAVYLVRERALRASRSFVPPGTLQFIMDATSSIDIDTQDDWERAEAAVSARCAPVTQSISIR